MVNDNNIEKSPSAGDLLKKIQDLEQRHVHIKQDISNLDKSSNKINNVNSGFGVLLTENHYENIMQSMSQSVHMFDTNKRIIYWNQMAQNLYGYTVDEAVGKTAPDIIIGPKYSAIATLIIHRGIKGESWSGEFPVRNKNWERFTVITTVSPSRDESGRINGAICVSTDARPFRELGSQAAPFVPWNRISDHHPRQTTIVSKISNLASKVKSKIKTGVDYDEDDPFLKIATFDSHSTCEESEFGVFSSIDSIHKVVTSKAEAWMDKVSSSWKQNEISKKRIIGFGWPWLHDDDQEPLGSRSYMKADNHEISSNEASGSWFSSNGASSSTSTTTNTISIIDNDNLDVEISWDDLVIKEQIGQGSYGTVYHALWDGSDVAVKVFPKQEYSDEVLLSFRKEVCLMKRLRHPNILLFMGAVTSPDHLSIVTEYLPRGSLFKLLQRNPTKLDWKRRVHMAMDIARGMNYLHHCHPPIVHLDLKSSNLLVDKNWNVKVGDFGLSRIKYETYLTTKTGNGTPQWMAPELLRNEQADEKSDVYSYGVVLWEITTEKIPWDNLNSMQLQVIGAVGFMNQRLEIPEGIDPQWASLIKRCCLSEAKLRPTFQEILVELKDWQRKFAKKDRNN